MRATGIVRRIDDLGRVVIPKEIRRTMHIREGEPLEIFTDKEGGVIFKKYSPIGEVSEFTMQYAEAINKTSGLPVAICDMDNVIAAAGVPKRELLSQPITGQLAQLLEKRKSFFASESGDEIPVTEMAEDHISYLSPIVSEGNVIGAVMSLKRKDAAPEAPRADAEKQLIDTGAAFLSRQMEI